MSRSLLCNGHYSYMEQRFSMSIGGGGTARSQVIVASHLMQRKEETPNVVQMIWRVFPGKKAMICTAVPQLIFVQAMHGHGISSRLNSECVDKS